MSVIATLVFGADGSSLKDGRSQGVTSLEDREAFLSRRRNVDCILIGGETARKEPYHRTPVPVVVVSRSMINSLSGNRLAYWWNINPIEALRRAKKKFGENILVEAGPSIVQELLDNNLIDGIEISVTEATDGERIVDYHKWLSKFASVRETKKGNTIFYSASNRM